MIAVSDNTAADLIIQHLGRSVVETHLTALGMQDPSITLPFLTTREFGLLKAAVDDEVQASYIAGSETDRRAILESIAAADAADVSVDGFVSPVAVDEIEWFATPNDLCRLGVELRGLAERPGLEPMSEMLSLAPGIPDPEGRWDSIWFKGGSEPGLLAAWWSVRDAAGREFLLAGSHVNPSGAVDSDAALLVWGATRALLVPQVDD